MLSVDILGTCTKYTMLSGTCSNIILKSPECSKAPPNIDGAISELEKSFQTLFQCMEVSSLPEMLTMEMENSMLPEGSTGCHEVIEDVASAGFV